MSTEDLQNRLDNSETKSTRRRNLWAYNTFQKWISSRNNNRLVTEKLMTSLEASSVEDMNKFMSYFICETRKVDGNLYPAKTLLSLVMGLQGYLKSKGVIINILNSPDFENTRAVLDLEMKRITQEGVGVQCKQADVFTPEMEDKLWTKKLLGDFNPRVLIRTLVFLNGKNFALRGGEEHRRLRYRPAQITLHEDGNERYLKYIEDMSKCNQGGLKSRRIHRKEVKHYANASCPERCHVRIFEKYMSLCPTEGRDGALYLQPLLKFSGSVWYSRNPLGHNTLRTMTATLAKEAGLSGNFTNHSLRATTATRLFHSGVSEQAIMDRTGHRSIEGM